MEGMETQTYWHDDPEEIVAFATWYFDGSKASPETVISVFEKPWLWDTEHAGYAAERLLQENHVPSHSQ